MAGIRIYIEGGGNSNEQKAALRRGFSLFFKELQDAVREKGLQWNIILCGSRQSAYDNYNLGLKTHPDSLNILLVDAEAPVAVNGKPWQHLAAQDQWRDPGVGDDYCHLMVQLVEAWLIADPEALEKYYGQGFNKRALQGDPNVEAIPKQDVLDRLRHATANTTKGRYNKINHCAELVKKIDAAKVRRRSIHCNRLFTAVIRLIE